MKKRFISFALVILLVFSLLPAAALAAGLQVITEVYVNGYTIPVIGEEPYDYVSIPGDAPYEVVTCKWYRFSRPGYADKIQEGETFEAGETYRMLLKIVPCEGFRFSSDEKPLFYLNGEAYSPGSYYSVTDEYYNCWGPEEVPRKGVSYTVYYSADDEIPLFGNTVAEGYCLNPGTPEEEGKIFRGWYYDKSFTRKFTPGTAIYEDTVLYGRWADEGDYIPIEEATVFPACFPPAAGETSENCGVWEEYGARYRVAEEWYCEDNSHGGTTGRMYADDIFYAGNQYSLKLRMVPNDHEYFDENVLFHVMYEGKEVEIEDSYKEHGEWILWTKAVEAAEYVSFYNDWGGAGIDVPKGSVIGNQGKPIREEGISFGGWYTDPSRTVPYDPKAPIMEDTTVYAKWIDDATGKALISHVSVTIATPRADKAPTYQLSYPVSGAKYYNDTAQDSGCYQDDIAWYNITDGNAAVAPTDTFVSGKVYRAEINLTAQSGYRFDFDYLTAEVNGSKIKPVKNGDKASLSYSDGKPALSEQSYCGDDLTWTLYNGTLTVSGTGAMYDYSATSAAPWESLRQEIKTVIMEKGVASVGDYAFHDCRSLTSVDIPASMKYIGKYAFYSCQKLEEIDIPAGVTEIGPGAFGSCGSLTGITVGENSKDFCSEDGVLFNKTMTDLLQYPAGKTDKSYSIPDSVFYIGSNAFENNQYLTDVTIPIDMMTVDTYAFTGCSGLTDVYYAGSKSQWKYIAIETPGNEPLKTLPIHLLLQGDVNWDGVLDMKDVSLLFRWWNGCDYLMDEQLLDAEMDDNGQVDLRDAALLYQLLAK